MFRTHVDHIQSAVASCGITIGLNLDLDLRLRLRLGLCLGLCVAFIIFRSKDGPISLVKVFLELLSYNFNHVFYHLFNFLLQRLYRLFTVFPSLSQFLHFRSCISLQLFPIFLSLFALLHYLLGQLQHSCDSLIEFQDLFLQAFDSFLLVAFLHVGGLAAFVHFVERKSQNYCVKYNLIEALNSLFKCNLIRQPSSKYLFC